MLPNSIVSQLFIPFQVPMVQPIQEDWDKITYPNKYNYNLENIMVKSLKFNLGQRKLRTCNKTLTYYDHILYSYNEPIAQYYFEGTTLKGIFVYNKTRSLRGEFYSITTSRHIHKLLYYLERYNIPYRYINDQYVVVDKKNKKLEIECNNENCFAYTSEETNCPICLNTETNEINVKLKDCGHNFHYNCLNTWLKQKLECPLCKQKLNNSNIKEWIQSKELPEHTRNLITQYH